MSSRPCARSPVVASRSLKVANSTLPRRAALIGAFATGNPLRFHDKSGDGYRLLRDTSELREDVKKRLSAIEALGKVGGDAESVQALTKVLYRGQWWAPFRTNRVRTAAAMALRATGSDEAQNALELLALFLLALLTLGGNHVVAAEVDLLQEGLGQRIDRIGKGQRNNELVAIIDMLDRQADVAVAEQEHLGASDDQGVVDPQLAGGRLGLGRLREAHVRPEVPR